MVRAVVLVALTACGRLDFSSVQDAGVVSDAGIDVGPACIGCTLADSEAEFSSTQGENGWYYGYWNPNTSYDFLPMSEFSGLWRPPDWEPDPSPSFTWCYVAAWGGHPGAVPPKIPIRRWTSDVVGRASITVRALKSDTSCGDGTHARVLVDGVERWSYDLDAMDNIGAVVEVPVELRIGTNVDFLLDARTNDACDTTTHSMVIHGP